MKKIIIALLFALISIISFYIYTNEVDIEIIPVITYHNIEVNPPLDRISYSIDDEKFKAHMEIINEKKYNTISLEEFNYKIKKRNKKLKMKLSEQKDIMITVDDGKKNNYEHLFPIIKKYNTKANLFIIGHRLVDLDENYMNREEIREMLESGLIQIGSHSYNMHYKKNKKAVIEKFDGEEYSVYKKRIENDILKSKDILEKNFNIKINSFAYPYGIFTEEAIDGLKNQGIDYAFTTDYGAFRNSNNRSLYKIERINIDGFCSKRRLIFQIEFFKRLAVLKYKLNL